MLRRASWSGVASVRRRSSIVRRLSGLMVALLLWPLVVSCRPDGQPIITGPLPTELPSRSARPARPARAMQPPNVLLITTDDQNVSDLVAMPRTRRLLQAHGMTFTQALSPHPLCCPARAEILTGQYAQNNGVRHNHGPFGGFSRLDPAETLGTWLQTAGYRTAFTGKYLNGYGASSPRPPGWDLWDPMVAGIYDYWGTEFRRPRAGDGRRYSVDAVADRTVDALVRFAGRNEPFFVWSSQVAPHATAGRAGSWNPPRAPAGKLPVPDIRAPSLDNPSFTTRPRTGSPCVCDRTSWTRADVQRFHRARLLSLQAVDLTVARAAHVLADVGHLVDTYIFFTTDNAFLMGEHGYFGKSTLYEENLRIPLLVRGPGVAHGSRSGLPVTLTDLAPTILQIARATGSEQLDGRSFLPTLQHRPQRWRDTQLIQTGSLAAVPGASGWGYRGVRTSRYTYGVQPDTGLELLLDRRLDRYEQQNRAGDPAYTPVLRELRRRTNMLKACRGAACSLRFGPVPPLSSRGAGPSRR